MLGYCCCPRTGSDVVELLHSAWPIWPFSCLQLGVPCCLFTGSQAGDN